MSTEIRKALVIDDEVPVFNPESIDKLRGGGNSLIIPWAALLELNQRRNKPETRWDADVAAIRIETICKQGDKSLRIFQPPSFTDLSGLDKRVAKHHVIATALELKSEMQKKRGKRKNKFEIDFEAVEIVSRDPITRILAGVFGIVAKDYLSDQVPVREYHTQEIRVSASCISHQGTFSYRDEFEKKAKIAQNEGVICNSDYYTPGEFQNSLAAIRKGNIFKIIPMNIHAAGLSPYSLNGNGPNWHQYIAFEQLLDPTIELVFLQGGTGAGKTLLALASAIEQEHRYWRTVITRPMVPLEDEDRMGFLPGTVDEKMAPWLWPIRQNLDFLKRTQKKNGEGEIGKTNNNIVASGRRKGKKNNRNSGNASAGKEKTGTAKDYKIEFVPLDYIRGSTHHKTLLIVDDAQNLTPHQAKSIITRAGEGAKFIFTGDLGQIDRRKRLDERSSGLAYGIETMNGVPTTGVTTFKETVRSHLASLAEERM